MTTIETNTPNKRLVIIGNGMVAGRFIDELTSAAHRYAITVIGDEPEGSYNRIMLSAVLAKDTTSEAIVQKNAQWYQSHNIDFKAGQKVTQINKVDQEISTACGNTYPYDELIIATGSRAATIPAENTDLEGIFAFRTIRDTHRIIQSANNAQQAIVVGGGLLGLEAAYGLAKSGVKVALVHRSGWLLNRQLDETAGNLLKNIMGKLGITFYLCDEVARFNGDVSGHITSGTLKSGHQLPCQLAIIATGITPNSELGEAPELLGKRAIEVDDFMQTRTQNISALGECIEHNGATFGLVDPLWRQAKVLAARLSGQSTEGFENAPIATKLKVSGISLFSAGKTQSDKHDTQWVIEDEKHAIYRKLILTDDKITGIVLFGDVSCGADYFDLMQSQTPVTQNLPACLIGTEFVDNPV